MAEGPFRRVVLLCDPACDIRLAVGDAATLAGRLGAALLGIFVDDENLHRFAGLPFGQYVSLSSGTLTEALTAANFEALSSALGAGMKRALAQIAEEQGLQCTFVSIRDLPSAAVLSHEEGDILVIETAARAFSGTWRPRSAWEKGPDQFSGSVLLKGRNVGRDGMVIVLPTEENEREKVLAASAAIATGDEDMVVVGRQADLGASEKILAARLKASQRARIKCVPLDDRSHLASFIVNRKPALVVLRAAEAAALSDGVNADVLLVR